MWDMEKGRSSVGVAEPLPPAVWPPRAPCLLVSASAFCCSSVVPDDDGKMDDIFNGRGLRAIFGRKARGFLPIVIRIDVARSSS